jgi:hypothetical protein
VILILNANRQATTGIARFGLLHVHLLHSLHNFPNAQTMTTVSSMFVLN